MNGALLAVFAYTWWGLVPAYWKLLHQFPADELILFRILFSVAFLLPFAFSFKGFRQWSSKQWLGLFLSGACIGANWFLYVWAVNNNKVVEASLGYFLNPLLNVAIGALVLREKLNLRQRTSCILAGIGLLYLLIQTGSLPLISLLLAGTFATYGFLRKKIRVPTLPATFMETVFMAIPAFPIFLIYWNAPQTHFHQATSWQWLLLALTGLVTTLPLLAFAEAAKRLSFSNLGLFQFISPSLQFLLGVFVFHEPFSSAKWTAFSFVWAGFILFLFDLYLVTENTKSQRSLSKN